MKEPSAVASLELARQAREAASAMAPALPPSGGGGTSGGMEARIAKLEADMEYVRRDVGDLRGDMRDVRDRLGRLEERVGHLPSKGFVVTATTASLALLTALVVFQGKLQALAGVVPH